MSTKAKGKATAAKKGATKKPAMAKSSSIEFSLFAPDASEVFIAGSFNNWEPSLKDYRMRKLKDNIWRKKLDLKPGSYEYQFVVDGNWWTDPANPDRCTNLYYTENSVITVKKD